MKVILIIPIFFTFAFGVEFGFGYQKKFDNNTNSDSKEEISNSNLAVENKNLTQKELDDFFMSEAMKEAKAGLSEGGIPIGSVLVKDNEIIGRGHNLRVQSGSPILHGEMNALDNAGRLTSDIYRNSTLYTTLSPCPMCSGAINLYNIPRIVIAENVNFKSKYGEDLLKEIGRDVTVMENKEAIDMMKDFIQNNPSLWDEDISIKDDVKREQSEVINSINSNVHSNHIESKTRLCLAILSFCLLSTIYLTFLYFSSKKSSMKRNQAFNNLEDERYELVEAY